MIVSVGTCHGMSQNCESIVMSSPHYAQIFEYPFGMTRDMRTHGSGRLGCGRDEESNVNPRSIFPYKASLFPLLMMLFIEF